MRRRTAARAAVPVTEDTLMVLADDGCATGASVGAKVSVSIPRGLKFGSLLQLPKQSKFRHGPAMGVSHVYAKPTRDPAGQTKHLQAKSSIFVPVPPDDGGVSSYVATSHVHFPCWDATMKPDWSTESRGQTMVASRNLGSPLNVNDPPAGHLLKSPAMVHRLCAAVDDIVCVLG